jgi:hydrogenase nickel incorporation protein HypA/HybF
MHELALCQAMLAQVEAIAREHQAHRVVSITLGMGPLSGVEESLLKHAYPVAVAGSLAEGAELLIRTTPIKVRCTACGEESDATANSLVCAHCGDWRTELISGDELLLVSVELDKEKTSLANALH